MDDETKKELNKLIENLVDGIHSNFKDLEFAIIFYPFENSPESFCIAGNIDKMRFVKTILSIVAQAKKDYGDQIQEELKKDLKKVFTQEREKDTKKNPIIMSKDIGNA